VHLSAGKAERQTVLMPDPRALPRLRHRRARFARASPSTTTSSPPTAGAAALLSLANAA